MQACPLQAGAGTTAGGPALASGFPARGGPAVSCDPHAAAASHFPVGFSTEGRCLHSRRLQHPRPLPVWVWASPWFAYGSPPCPRDDVCLFARNRLFGSCAWKSWVRGYDSDSHGALGGGGAPHESWLSWRLASTRGRAGRARRAWQPHGPIFTRTQAVTPHPFTSPEVPSPWNHAGPFCLLPFSDLQSPVSAPSHAPPPDPRGRGRRFCRQKRSEWSGAHLLRTVMGPLISVL